MVLSDVELKKLIEDGYLPTGLHVGPSSVDLTLSDSFCWPDPKENRIVLGEPVHYQQAQSDTFTLAANRFVLASTAEIIRVPDDMAAYVEGRSSIGPWDCKSRMPASSMAVFMGKSPWSWKTSHVSH